MSDELRRLVDRQAIADVLSTYCRLLDRNRFGEVVQLFTEDAVTNYLAGSNTELRGREALLAFLESALSGMSATSHHVSNVEIEITGADEARSVAYVYAWHRWKEERPDLQVYAQYHDQWTRTAEGWRIASRRLEAQGSSDASHPFEPIERRS